MNFQLQPHLMAAKRKLPFECVALLLQGGGALGAYQGGVYEALAEADIHPNWIAGISIGAINAAIIAGNPPNSRIDRLREFWTQVTSSAPWDWSGNPFVDFAKSDDARNLLNQMSAGLAAAFGATGFFTARAVMPWLQPGGSMAATSFYDTKHLKQTLERLVDFDRLNAGMTRFSAGAVNVRTGNFAYFDTSTHKIAPEHVMASGALPPGFPAVEIDGEQYWDGGLVSNTPLQWVIESDPRRKDTLAFQVDLWSSQGAIPRNLAEVATRHKEIQFSSRTRASTAQFKSVHRVQRALAALLQRLPADLEENDDLKILKSVASDKVYNIIQLIYRARNYEGHSKDYEFSRLSMQDHWSAGYHDAVRTLRHPEVLTRHKPGWRLHFRSRTRRSRMKEVNVKLEKEMKMREEEVLKRAFAMPLTSPAYPPGPYRFVNREYLIITYRTDPVKLRAVVPGPLDIDIDEALVKYEFIRMPDSNGFGDYTESGQVIPVSFRGRKGSYTHCMFLNDEGPIAGGRELWGFPKKLAQPTLRTEVDTLVGTLDYGPLRIATGTMGYKHCEADLSQVRASLAAPNFLLKIIPHVDGTPRICELVEYHLKDITIKGAWTGPAALHLMPHALAPVADLPVLEVVSAVHILADLTLGLGKVVHDYLQQPSRHLVKAREMSLAG